ncbi:unnamed protein product [Toxocara canis]|uniref:Bromo domain-containing protein n=1 Tax=Toxocara canis TaxID=6265 RepID=A0A183UUD9_TOXCA|nr:unnamed protein product [Toxocara canis]
MVGQNSDKEPTDTIKAMKELMGLEHNQQTLADGQASASVPYFQEAIRAEGARRAAKLDAVFNDDFHATIKNAENMGIEMQSKAAMFEKILRTQSLIKRRTKETEFERSMKVLKKRQDSAKNKATIGAETGTTTVKDNSEVYEGSETSTTMKKSSDSRIDSKCSIGGATSVDDKDVTKKEVAVSAEFNNKPLNAVESPESTPRNKKFTFKGIGEATLLRLGQWRKNAARILHISKSSHEQPRRRNARKKGIARLKSRLSSRLSRRRRLLGKAATSPTSSNAHKAINIGQTVRRRHKVRSQKIQPSSATSSSSDNKGVLLTTKDIVAADSSTQKIINIRSPMSKDPLNDNVPPEARSLTATESKSTPVDASSLTGASSPHNESDQMMEKKKNTSRTKKIKKGRSKKHCTAETASKPPPKQATEKKRESGSADADDSSTMTGKSINADTKIEDNNVNYSL